MLYLILAIVAVAWLISYRKYVLLRRRVGQLAVAVRQKRSFLDEDGRSIGLLPDWVGLRTACNELIAESTKLRSQQRSQLQQLEATLGNLQEAVLIVDQNNYILLVNNALRNIFPGAGQILNERIESVLHSAAFLDLVGMVRAGAPVPQQEIEFSDGSRSTWVEVSGSMIPGIGEGSGPCSLFVLHDISRQKRLEAVRKEFVANVSHELKTPLSVIKGYIETLVEDHRTLPPADRERFLKTIQKHSDRLISILEDLLTLSRLESKNAGVHLKALNINVFVKEIADDLRPRIAASGHQLAIETDDEELVVSADPLKLTQVFQNLLDNAVKYTPAGSTIEIGVKSVEEGINLWVRDDGPGIPEKDLPHVFERFYRVDKGRSRETGGTGLGLSIVKHIILLHGGQVWVDSVLGEGTTIGFSLKR